MEDHDELEGDEDDLADTGWLDADDDPVLGASVLFQGYQLQVLGADQTWFWTVRRLGQAIVQGSTLSLDSAMTAAITAARSRPLPCLGRDWCSRSQTSNNRSGRITPDALRTAAVAVRQKRSARSLARQSDGLVPIPLPCSCYQSESHWSPACQGEPE